jgi:hypothetical protein
MCFCARKRSFLSAGTRDQFTKPDNYKVTLFVGNKKKMEAVFNLQPVKNNFTSGSSSHNN